MPTAIQLELFPDFQAKQRRTKRKLKVANGSLIKMLVDKTAADNYVLTGLMATMMIAGMMGYGAMRSRNHRGRKELFAIEEPATQPDKTNLYIVGGGIVVTADTMFSVYPQTAN